MNALSLLGYGLLKKDKKEKATVKNNMTLSKLQKNNQRTRNKRAASVELFLRQTLGTHLIKIEKKYY